jgi:hypothetical protein
MKKRANPDSEANIRRIDSKPRAKKQTHGFQVHFLRGSDAVTKMFSDTVYGGKESARRAARKFKKTAMADLPDRVFRGPLSAEEKRGNAKQKTKSAGKAAGPKRSAKPKVKAAASKRGSAKKR